MNLTAIPILLTLPLLLMIAAWCAAMETAIFSLTYQDRLRLRKLSPTAADAAAAALARPRATLISLLFFNMLAATLYLVLTALLEHFITLEWVHWLVVAFNVLLMTIVGEVVSKLIAGRMRVELCQYFATWVTILLRLMAPLRLVLDDLLISPLVRVLTPSGRTEADRLTDEELSNLLLLGRDQGTIDHGEVSVLRQVISFGQLRVKEVMTPRVDLEWIDERATPAMVMEIVKAHRLTRLPIAVAGGELDDGVIGVLNTKTYLAHAAKGSLPALKDFTDPVTFVPAGASLDKLLESFRVKHMKMAMCVDEYGSVVGIVGMADIARRLMAELSENSATGDEESRIELVALGVWSVPGRLPARDWASMFGLKTDRRVTTIAGLIMDQLGRLPRVGDEIAMGNLRLRVESIRGRVVDRVLIAISEHALPPSSPRTAPEARA